MTIPRGWRRATMDELKPGMPVLWLKSTATRGRIPFEAPCIVRKTTGSRVHICAETPVGRISKIVRPEYLLLPQGVA